MRLLVAALLLSLAGCAAPSGAAPSGTPTGATPPPSAVLPTTPPSTSQVGVPLPGGTPKTGAPVSPPKTPSSPGKPRGTLAFDQLAVSQCYWVPRMFANPSGPAKPGVLVRVPLTATQLDTRVAVTVSGELYGSGYRTTDTITLTPPEWRGSTALSMAVPDSGDALSVYLELDANNTLAGKTAANSRRILQATLPTPRPTAEQPLACSAA